MKFASSYDVDSIYIYNPPKKDIIFRKLINHITLYSNWLAFIRNYNVYANGDNLESGVHRIMIQMVAFGSLKSYGHQIQALN